MNPEKLAMLTAHGLDPDHIPGGVPELTAEDIAGGLAGLDPLEHEYMRVKYCGDDPYKLFARWLVWLRHNCPRGWSPSTTEYTARFTIAEAVSANRCPACKGVQELVIDRKKMMCPACGGSGMRYERPDGAETEIEWARKELHRLEYAALQKIASR